jgi:hypothetical protein
MRLRMMKRRKRIKIGTYFLKKVIIHLLLSQKRSTSLIQMMGSLIVRRNQ